MSEIDYEKLIKECYSTWSKNYYKDFYGNEAAYPPVHRELLKQLLSEAKVKRVLDAGCGPASFLREIAHHNYDIYGFDITSEMVVEAKRIMEEIGVDSNRIWEGNVRVRESFLIPGDKEATPFDAAICVGVLPHIPEEADIEVILNLRSAVRKNGLVIIEARNKLFSLFTLNRYSHQFFLDELIKVNDLKNRAGEQLYQLINVLKGLEKQFRMDMPPMRNGKAGKPGYDEVLSRTHNPLVLKEQFGAAGFKEVQLLFYHYHCLPPMFDKELPDLFLKESLKMEDPKSWRGYFMASAFLLAGRRV